MNTYQKSDMKSFLDSTIKAISIALELPAAIWLFDENRRKFRMICSSGLSDEFIRDAVVNEERAVSVIKEKFENRNSLIVPDIQASDFCPRKKKTKAMNLKSAVAATLRIKTQAVGGLLVYVPKDISADFEKLAIKAETFAVEIANIIQQSEELQKKTENLESAIRQIAETQDILTRSIVAADIVHRLNNLIGTIPIQPKSCKYYQLNIDKYFKLLYICAISDLERWHKNHERM